MSTFVSTYFAWAAPNILPAMASAAAAIILVGWLRGRGILPQPITHLVMPIGAAAAGVVVLSAAAAILGLQPGGTAESFGIVAGVVASLPFWPKRG